MENQHTEEKQLQSQHEEEIDRQLAKVLKNDSSGLDRDSRTAVDCLLHQMNTRIFLMSKLVTRQAHGWVREDGTVELCACVGGCRRKKTVPDPV